jgi:signal transduction histidine kinase/CheY-like chemotaxis protein
MLRLKHWSDFRLRAKGLIVVAFPATATVAIACAAYWMASLAERAELSVNRSLQISETLQSLRTGEIETSAAHRGYMLTGDAAFSDRVHATIGAFDDRLQALAGAVAYNPVQQSRLSEIAEFHRARAERVHATVDRFRNGELSPSILAETFRAAENDRLRMDRLIGAMLDDEKSVLNVRVQRMQALRARMRAVIGIFVFVGVLGGVIISVLFASGITSRIGRLAENVAKLAQGCPLDPGPGGGDEIGLLGRGIAGAAEILSQKTAAFENALHGFAQAKDAAVSANQAKTAFLAKISHDIRTPLNAVLGASDLLAQTTLDEEQREYVTMFQRNSERLVALINDFLDFSRIEAGAVRVERVPLRLRQIADDAIRTFHESAARKGVALSVEIAAGIPDWIMGDPLRIQQVLTNLLSNALKFTQQGRVTVRLACAGADSNPQVGFEIADTGPGIAPEDQSKIFSPFTQLPNQKATSIKGSGLGLAICRELVQLMGGEIGVRSIEGAGSTFWFTVPLERAQPTTARDASPRAPLQKPRSLRILIAEDSQDNRTLLRAYLRNRPITFEFAENGMEAVEAVQRSEYDLILMDIDMPELDGRAATRRILDWEVSAGRLPTPIVALSAHAIREEVRLCLDSGCVAHVAKPVDQATLLQTIERYARAPRTPRTADSVEHPALPSEFAALVADYLASKPRQIEEALGHLARHDFAPIRRFGHNLKGTGRGYGFPEIEEVGKTLEKLAQEDDEAGIADGLLALHRIVTTVSAPPECEVIPFKLRSK